MNSVLVPVSVVPPARLSEGNSSRAPVLTDVLIRSVDCPPFTPIGPMTSEYPAAIVPMLRTSNVNVPPFMPMRVRFPSRPDAPVPPVIVSESVAPA